MKIGMIGTGRIAHRFVPEARSIDGMEIVAVCNPRQASAKDFAAEFQIPVWVTDVEDLKEMIEAVYIATPHETHYLYAKELLSSGIHVLCEKPLVLNKEQAVELFNIADKNHCVLMEAIKTAYCPGFLKLLELIKEGRIGAVRDVETCFTRLTPTNVREMTEVKTGGSFLELGTYSLLPIMKLLGMKEHLITYQSIKGINGIDIYTKAFLEYDNAMGTAKTGLGVKSEGELVIAGTKGYIVVQAPWWLTKHFEIGYEDPNKIECYDFVYEGAGLRYEIKEFIKRTKQIDKVSFTEDENIDVAESIWLAQKMEQFTYQSDTTTEKKHNMEGLPIRIWAHRGCSMLYPENTIQAFCAAAEIPQVTGIELDVQLTKDKKPVVIHDEEVDRTTNGTGRVCDYCLENLKMLQIASPDDTFTSIPTLEEVFKALLPVCRDSTRKSKFMINIELKNSIIRYDGMEEIILNLVQEYGLLDNVIFSSFLPESMETVKKIQPSAKTGILGMSMEKCLKEANRVNADAIHPWIGGLDLSLEEAKELKNFSVRVWNGEEPYYGQNRLLKRYHIDNYLRFGVTDMITNAPEMYLD